MLAMIAALAMTPTDHLPACGGHVVTPSSGEAAADAVLVSHAAGHATKPADIGTVMAARDWRIVWATPGDTEPGVFFFRRVGAGFRLIDIWVSAPRTARVTADVTDDNGQRREVGGEVVAVGHD